MRSGLQSYYMAGLIVYRSKRAYTHFDWLRYTFADYFASKHAKRLVTNPTSATKNLRDLISGTTRNAKCEFRGIIRRIFVAMM